MPFWLKFGSRVTPPEISIFSPIQRGEMEDSLRGKRRPPEPFEPPPWMVRSGKGKEKGGSKGDAWKKKAKAPEADSQSVKTGVSNEKGGDEPILGRSSGVLALGVWAARLEVASLLEARCEPDLLVRAIRSGKETEQDIQANGALPPSVRHAFEEPDVPSPLSPVVSEDEVEKQRAILASFSSATVEPGWLVEGDRSSAKVPAWARSSSPRGFGKAALPPDPRTAIKGIVGAISPGTPVMEESDLAFSKRAMPPPTPYDPEKRPKILEVPPGKGRRADAISMKERERVEMGQFLEKAVDLYDRLRARGLDLSITELVEDKSSTFDKQRFATHVSPNRARTGLRYVRLFLGLMKWQEGKANPFEGRSEPFEQLNVLLYMECLADCEVGARTLQSLLYSMDYFARAFGFSMGGGHLGRAKRLALRYAQLTRTDRKAAPLFGRKVMVALERVLLDENFSFTKRVACGKLRLCIQSSMRHDDLLNTPIAHMEWVRRKAEISVVGLRSKATKGKSGARAWVCSVLAADPANDGWLPKLVELLVHSHGIGWEKSDHCGRMPSADMEGFTLTPATLEADVVLIKQALLEASRIFDVGMTEFDISTLRFHGAKATLTSLMQHMGLPPRVVRLSGDWSKRDESMADTYLREAQLLQLKGQERCLAYLRKGGDIGGLVGESILRTTTESKPFASADPEMGPSDVDVEMSLGDFSIGPAAVEEGLLDDTFVGGLPDLGKVEAEKQPSDLDYQLVNSLMSDADTEEIYASSEGERMDSEEKGGCPPKSQLDVEQELGDEDEEGLTCSFVMVRKPLTSSKLHLPKMVIDDEMGDFPVMPVPRCGAKGSYDFIGPGEKIVSEPCIRCFGVDSGCKAICDYRATKGDKELACARRCAGGPDCGGVHVCVIHDRSDDV